MEEQIRGYEKLLESRSGDEKVPMTKDDTAFVRLSARSIVLIEAFRLEDSAAPPDFVQGD